MFQEFPLPLLCMFDEKVIRCDQNFLDTFMLNSCEGSIDTLPPHLSQAIFVVREQMLNRHVFTDSNLIAGEIVFIRQEIKLNHSDVTLYIFIPEIETLGLLEGEDLETVKIHRIFLYELEKSMQDEIKNCLLTQRRYKQLFYNRRDGIFIVTCNTHSQYEILDANENALQMVGIDNVKGMDFLKLIVPRDRQDILKQILSLSVQDHFMVTAYALKQDILETFPVEVFGQSFKYAGEEDIYLTLTDISHCIALERERDYHCALIQEKGKMASVGEMINVIAYQWRQPLNVLVPEVSYLNDLHYDQNLDGEDFKICMGQIRDQIDFVNHTINDFQGFFHKVRKRRNFS